MGRQRDRKDRPIKPSIWTTPGQQEWHIRTASLMRFERHRAWINDQLPENQAAEWEKFAVEQEEARYREGAAYRKSLNRALMFLPGAGAVAVGLLIGLGGPIVDRLRADDQSVNPVVQLSEAHQNNAEVFGRGFLLETGKKSGLTAAELKTLETLPISVTSASFDTSDSRYQPGAKPDAVGLTVGRPGPAAFEVTLQPSHDQDAPDGVDFAHPTAYGWSGDLDSALKAAVEDYQRNMTPGRTNTGMGAADIPHPHEVRNIVARGTVQVGNARVPYSVTRSTSPGTGKSIV